MCLENFDQIALLTHNKYKTFILTLCGHKFDANCILSWQENTCAVCWYENTPEELVFCEDCNENLDLWMCFVCGFTGCGIGSP